MRYPKKYQFGQGKFNRGKFSNKLGNLVGMGLTFYKDFRNCISLYSVGSPTSTYTRSTSATNPATYVDANGVIHLVTTDNTPRYQGGYYDATGFHAVNSGVMIEAAGTNLLTDTCFHRDTNSDGVSDNWGSIASGVVASRDSTDLPGGSNLTGTDAAQVLTFNGSNANFFHLAQNVTISATTSYTISGYYKAMPGFVQDSSNIIELWGSSIISIYFSTTGIVADGTWKKFSCSGTSTGGGTASLRLGRADGTAGEQPIGIIKFAYIQLEASPYATSFIPTTTAALTRNAEVLKYAVSGNRTAEQETIVIKFMPSSDFANDGQTRFVIDSDDDRIYMTKLIDGTVLVFAPNGTDSGSVIASTGNILANTSYIIGTVAYGALSENNISIYVNGSHVQTTTSNYTERTLGTNFYIGTRYNSVSQFNGSIAWVKIFNRALTASEIATLQ